MFSAGAGFGFVVWLRVMRLGGIEIRIQTT
jgi:hypothetical protein